jgi:hypothetical protein
MRRVPLLAGRCPYCRDENQGVYGRIILILLSIVIVFLLAHNTEMVLGWLTGDKPVTNKEVIDGKKALNEVERLIETFNKKGETKNVY